MVSLSLEMSDEFLVVANGLPVVAGVWPPPGDRKLTGLVWVLVTTDGVLVTTDGVLVTTDGVLVTTDRVLVVVDKSFVLVVGDAVLAVLITSPSCA